MGRPKKSPQSAGMSARPKDLVFPAWHERAMREADLAQILNIEDQAYQYPWSEGVFRDCMRMHYVCRVVEDDDARVQGYALMSYGAGEAHILNLCVARAHRRLGLGRFILQRLTDIAVQQRIAALYLEVRPTNLAALALYKASGFTEIGQRRGYYPSAEGREDAIILARILD